METDRFPCNFMSDIEYSVITSDVIKSFDCNMKIMSVNIFLQKDSFQF